MERRRKGVGLVELIVATVCALVLLTVVLAVTSYSVRTIAGVERHAESMHAAQMNLERIEADLQRVLLRDQKDLSLFAGSRVADGALVRVAWNVAEPGPSGRQAVYVGVPVEYRRLPAGNGLFHLLRNGEKLSNTLFSQLEFCLETTAALAPGRRVQYVRTRLTGLDGTARTRFMLEALTAVDPLCQWSRGQAFNPNPDDQAPVLAFTAPR
jgi:type II secretory pathway component PulJ